MNLSEVYIKKYPAKVLPNRNGIINPILVNFKVLIEPPEKPSIGSVSYDTDSGRAYIYNGSEWMQIGVRNPWEI